MVVYPYDIESHKYVVLTVYQTIAFYAQFEDHVLAKKSTVWPISGSQKLHKTAYPSISCIKGRLWDTSEAMYVYHYNTTSLLSYWEGTGNLSFCVWFESLHQLKWHHINYKQIADAVKRALHLHIHIKDRLRIISKAMDISPRSTSFHLLCWDCTQISHFAVHNLGADLGGK